MHYLNNELKIIHRDLRTENIYLANEDNRLQIKLGNFEHSLNNVTNMYRNRLNYNSCIKHMVILLEKNFPFNYFDIIGRSLMIPLSLSNRCLIALD